MSTGNDVSSWRAGAGHRGPRTSNLGGLASGQQSWINNHLVYTHGYGVVSAGRATRSRTDGTPDVHASATIPPKGTLVDSFEPRIYFGGELAGLLDRRCQSPAPLRREGLDFPKQHRYRSDQHDPTPGKGRAWPCRRCGRRPSLTRRSSPTRTCFSRAAVNDASRILYVRGPEAAGSEGGRRSCRSRQRPVSRDRQTGPGAVDAGTATRPATASRTPRRTSLSFGRPKDTLSTRPRGRSGGPRARSTTSATR